MDSTEVDLVPGDKGGEQPGNEVLTGETEVDLGPVDKSGEHPHPGDKILSGGLGNTETGARKENDQDLLSVGKSVHAGGACGTRPGALHTKEATPTPGVDDGLGFHRPNGGDGRSEHLGVVPPGTLPAEESKPSSGVDDVVVVHQSNGGDGREHLRGALPGALAKEKDTPKPPSGVDDGVDVGSPILADDNLADGKCESFTKEAVEATGTNVLGTNSSHVRAGEDALTKRSEVKSTLAGDTLTAKSGERSGYNPFMAESAPAAVDIVHTEGWENYLARQQELQTSLVSRLTSFESRKIHFEEEQKKYLQQYRVDIDQIAKGRCEIESLKAELEAKQKVYLDRQVLDNKTNQRLENTYYAAQLCRIYGRNEVIASTGPPNDESFHASLLNRTPKDDNAWNKRQILYMVIFMVFLPLVFGLEVLFTSKKTDHWMQIVAFSFIGAVWGLLTIGGLFGLFNTPSNILQSWTSHLACLMFLAICLVKVGALWYAMPNSLASNIVVGVIAVGLCFGHIYSWAQHYRDSRPNNAQTYP